MVFALGTIAMVAGELEPWGAVFAGLTAATSMLNLTVASQEMMKHLSLLSWEWKRHDAEAERLLKAGDATGRDVEELRHDMCRPARVRIATPAGRPGGWKPAESWSTDWAEPTNRRPAQNEPTNRGGGGHRRHLGTAVPDCKRPVADAGRDRRTNHDRRREHEDRRTATPEAGRRERARTGRYGRMWSKQAVDRRRCTRCG